MHELIKGIELLNESDREILRVALDEHLAGRGFRHASTMSIFSDSFELTTTKEYSIEQHCGSLHYLGRAIMGMSPVFVDDSWRIVFSSNSALSRPENFIPTIDIFLKRINHFKQHSKPRDTVLSHVMAVQAWYPSYGHLHDEFTILAHNLESRPSSQPALVDYHLGRDFHGKLDPVNNAIEMHCIMLGHGTANAYIRGQSLISLRYLSLIRNSAQDSSFHSFPCSVSSKLMKLSADTIAHAYDHFKGIGKPLYLGRRGGARSHRLASNSDDIEHMLLVKGFHVAYPEQYSFLEVIYLISKAPVIVLTWGSAMTNLAYASPNTKIVVIKAKSYASESLFLFRKIIDSRGLVLTVTEADDDNNINMSSLAQCVS